MSVNQYQLCLQFANTPTNSVSVAQDDTTNNKNHLPTMVQPHQVSNPYSPRTAKIVNDLEIESMGMSSQKQMNNNTSFRQRLDSLISQNDQSLQPNADNSKIYHPVNQMMKDNVGMTENPEFIPQQNNVGSSDMPAALSTGSSNEQNFNKGGNRKTLMQIRRKFGELGPAIGQFNSPHGFCIDAQGNILIAD